MVRADLLDNIDLFLKINRNNNEPFGGVKMIFFGDLFQIPPVVNEGFEKIFFYENYESPYFFSSEIMKSEEVNFQFIELNEIFRQTDLRFIKLLETIRTNTFDLDSLEELNQRVLQNFESDNKIILCSRNTKVNTINSTKLEEIREPNHIYEAKITGNFPQSIYPTEDILNLKVGAQVMFIRNNQEKNYVNGTIGVISELSDKSIKVKIISKGELEEINVDKELWENIEYYSDIATNSINQRIIGSFSQYPVKLAWAITIHKSQGKTFENVIIDLDKGAFTHGMTYVALSRCTSLEGVILTRQILPRDIIVDELIEDYLQQLRRK